MFRSQVTNNVFIHDGGRSHATRSQASCREQRDLAILCRLARGNMIGIRNSTESALTAFDITGGSLAQDASMFPFWLECKGMIERCYTIDLAEWNMQFIGDEA